MEGEFHLAMTKESMHMEREVRLAMTQENMHMDREFRLAMTFESIYALRVRIHNHDRGLSLDPIAKLTEPMPYCLLTGEGYWIANHV